MRERRDDVRQSRRDATRSVAASRFAPDGRADGPREEEMPPLPPRRVKFPSNKHQMARWFYNSLIVLFLALMVTLFLLGQRMYENGG